MSRRTKRYLRYGVLLAPVLISLGFAGCAKGGIHSAYERGGIASRLGASQVLEGKASWYGPRFHGRKTASGERYNMYELTCAHKTLPFGALLRVTNLDNDRELFVRVNDRGPYIGGRFLDLSYAAARELGMIQKGVAPVKVEVFPR